MDDNIASVRPNPLPLVVIRVIDAQLLQQTWGIAIKAFTQSAFQECGCKHVRIVQTTSAGSVSGEKNRKI